MSHSFPANPNRSVKIVSDRLQCANCGDQRQDVDGVCMPCYELHRKGTNIQIKCTLDKDEWTCGCKTRPEGMFYCKPHHLLPGPMGVYHPDWDLRRKWKDYL